MDFIVGGICFSIPWFIMFYYLVGVEGGEIGILGIGIFYFRKEQRTFLIESNRRDE